MDERTAAMKLRTKQFALRIVRLFQSLPKRADAYIIGKQLLRSGTSVAANYHSACRARSLAEFSSKLGIIQEEADETVFWLELLSEAGIVPPARLELLIEEANELTAIVTAARKTSQAKLARQKPPAVPG